MHGNNSIIVHDAHDARPVLFHVILYNPRATDWDAELWSKSSSHLVSVSHDSSVNNRSTPGLPSSRAAHFPPPPVLRPRYTQFITTTAMLGAAFLWCTFSLADALQDQSGFGLRNIDAYAQPSPNYKVTCEKIARSISSKSQVFYPGERREVSLQCTSYIDIEFLDSHEFNFDISHWANTSSQVSLCSVEPETPNDVASIVNLVLLTIHTCRPADVSSQTPTAPPDCRRSRVIRSERRWTRYQPWLFINSRRTHFNDPVQ